MQVFINNTARFCYQSKEKVLSSDFFLEECKCELKKIKMENLLDYDLEKRLSDESGSESDNDSNDQTESDDEKDNESNE